MQRAMRRFVRKHGHSVLLQSVSPEAGSEDEYGDATLAVTEATITALRQLARGRNTPERTPAGAIPAADAVYWVEDSATIAAGGTAEASRFVDGGSTFVATFVDDQHTGVLAVSVERRRL